VHDVTIGCKRESPDPNQGQATPLFVPQGSDQELNPPKEKTSKSGYGQVNS